MAVPGLTRRGSFNILRSVNRNNSCPDLSQTLPRITRPTNNVSSRNLNLMVMNPRGPKIRHLNASNPLLIELEENVQKVQVSLQNKNCIMLFSQRAPPLSFLNSNVFSGIGIQSAGVREAAADEGTPEEAAEVCRES